MNEQLQKALADILTMLSESAKAISETGQAEIPLLVQEYLRWGFWSAVMDAVIGGVMLVLAVRFLLPVCRKASSAFDEGYDSFIGWACLAFALGVGGVIGFFTLWNGAYVAIKVTVAPRVYLLETVMETLK